MADKSAGGVPGAAPQLIKILRQLDRDDLVGRATAAAARLKRPATVVCVVGEFKQGKSSLVNGLLGREICPVDDDLATAAITLVRFGDEESATIRRKVDGKAVAEKVPLEQLDEWVTEAGNPENRKGVERVELTVPSKMLKQGLVIVDTPGMGGLGAGHAAATLSFLPFADGLILTSDASAELSAPEVEFLQRATELCPTVLFVQTKTDLYPAWERVLDLNRGHLQRSGLNIDVVHASSALRMEALSRKDRDLNTASQFPNLVDALETSVVKPAKETAQSRSEADLRSLISMVRAGLQQEKNLLDDPEATERGLADLEHAKEKLEHLRGPAARWNVLVGDEISDLSAKVMHDFRGGMRALNRGMDELIEQLAKGDDWDEMTRQLQTEVADEVTKAFVAIEEGRIATRQAVIEMLRDEQLVADTSSSVGSGVDVSRLWQDKPLGEKGSKAGGAFKTGVTGIRGAQGGVYMFGMLGNFLPAAAATLLASNPVLLGAGAIFGGMQLMDDRKRKVTQKRQAARTQVRQFIDDVQFEVNNEISGLVKEAQRSLRDEFTERIGQLQKTYTETAQRAQSDAKAGAEEQGRRKKELAQQLAGLDEVEKLMEQPR